MSTKLRRTKVSIAGDITTYLLLALYATFMALPLIYVVVQSVKPYNELFILSLIHIWLKEAERTFCFEAQEPFAKRCV